MPRRSPTRIAPCGASALALAIACGWAGPLAAGPAGGVVAHGDAAIRQSGQVTAVQQSSDRIIIDWQSFDVDAGETVRFEQPDAKSVALNRVAAGAASRIEGAIEANGNVWLVNPSGVMFGGGSRVDVGGLIVSTADISDDNFINGNMAFDRPGDPGAAIVNEGGITFAEAGLAAFVAPEVINRGRIAGRLGRITIAGRDSFAVDISGDGMFAIDLSDAAPALHARLVNEGEISAEGGVVVIDAAALRDAVDGSVSAGGVVSAASAEVDGGKIVLSGGRVDVSGTVDATSGAGTGGTIAMTGDLVHVQTGALVDASGARGGGTVRIGALAPGMAPMPARRTLVAAGATVRADGGEVGGDVLVWGDEASMVRGALSATGAKDGGRIEISSPADILFTGTADASGGLTDGLVLFDPAFLTIGAAGTHDAALSDDQILADEGGAATYYIAATTLNGMSGMLVLQAADTIRIDEDVSFAGALTLEAGRDILLFADLHADAALTLSANAAVIGAPAITDGSIRIDAGRSIDAGGALLLQTGAQGRLDGGSMGAGDVLQLAAGGDLTASAMTLAGDLSVESRGNARLNKDMQLSGDVDVTTHGGAITLASFTGAIAGDVALDARGDAATAGVVTVQLGGTLNLAGLDARSANIVGRDGIDGAGPVTLTQGGTFQSTAGDISLTNAANSFGGPVRALTGAGSWDIDLRAAGDLTLEQIFSDTARLRAGGAVTQIGTVRLTGDGAVQAGGDITLSNGGNSFGGALRLSGQAATISATGPVTFGASTLASLSATVNGAIGQSGALDVAGGTAVSTSGDAVALEAVGNMFGGGISVLTTAGGATAADVSLAADGALSLGAITADGLRAQAGAALTQTAALTAARDVSLVSNGVLALNQNNSIAGDLDAASQGGDISVVAAGATIGGAMSLNARGGATLGDVLVQIDGAASLGAMDARQVQVYAKDGIDGPGALSVSGAARFETDGADIALTNAANSFGAEIALVSNPGATGPGDVALAATGDALLAELGAQSAAISATGDIRQSGAATILATSTFTAGGDLDLSHSANSFGGAAGFSGVDVQVTAADELALAATSAQTLHIETPGALSQSGAVSVAQELTLDVGGGVALARADNHLSTITGGGATAILRDADGFDLAGFDAAQLTIGAEGDRQAGSVVIGGNFGDDSSVYTTGDVGIDPSFGASFDDRAILDAGGDLVAADRLSVGAQAVLNAAGDVRIATLDGESAAVSGHDVTIGAVVLSDALSAVAGNDLRLGDISLATRSSAGSAQLQAGGGAQISALDSAAGLSAVAGAGIDLSASTAAGDVILSTASGDVRLAGVDVGGDFGAHSGGGAIRSRSLVGQVGPALSVAGATRFDAFGAVRLPAADGSAGHAFGGPVSITRASEVAIEASGDLSFGAVDIAFDAIDAESLGGIFDRTGNGLSGGIHLKSSGGIATLGDSYIRADGDLRFDAAGAVALLGANDIGGAVSGVAETLAWAELGGILLADLATTGDLQLIAGMDGGFGDASIRQGGVAVVPRLAMIEGVAQSGTESFSGPMVVGGDLDLSSGLATGVALASVREGGEVDRDVQLTDPDNVFHGAVAVRRIAGAVALVEESGAETVAQDEIDGGDLHLRQIEVGGDISITTSDDVIFDGRMTALLDEDTPEAKPSIPVGPQHDDPTRQGLIDLAPDEFRLWLSDGATLTVDATGGGADASGGLIRLDRPVDGFNDLLPARTLQSVNQRAGAASVQLIAGGGDVRFRDFVGAGAPVGDVTIHSAHDVAIGHTYGARSPDGASPQSRYLLGRAEESDVFFASNLKIDATGDVTVFAPPGLRDSYESADAFFGVNLRGFTYGLSLRPTRVEAFGFIGGSSRKAAGLYPVGPRAPQYNLNGCVIGDVADCTGVSAPNVLTVLRLDRAQILNVEREDLFELFVSYGNEELWGVPQGYILDLKYLGSGDEDEEDQQDAAQVAPLRGAGE